LAPVGRQRRGSLTAALDETARRSDERLGPRAGDKAGTASSLHGRDELVETVGSVGPLVSRVDECRGGTRRARG
jgi:hypothetical protein